MKKFILSTATVFLSSALYAQSMKHNFPSTAKDDEIPAYGTCCVCMASTVKHDKKEEGAGDLSKQNCKEEYKNIQCDSKEEFKDPFDLSKLKQNKTCKNLKVFLKMNFGFPQLPNWPFEQPGKLAKAYKAQKIEYVTNAELLLANHPEVVKEAAKLAKEKSPESEFVITGRQTRDPNSMLKVSIAKDGKTDFAYSECSEVGKSCLMASSPQATYDNSKQCKNKDGKVVWQNCCGAPPFVGRGIVPPLGPKTGNWVVGIAGEYPSECPPYDSKK